jgi:hypothetical protein
MRSQVLAHWRLRIGPRRSKIVRFRVWRGAGRVRQPIQGGRLVVITQVGMRALPPVILKYCRVPGESRVIDLANHAPRKVENFNQNGSFKKVPTRVILAPRVSQCRGPGAKSHPCAAV